MADTKDDIIISFDDWTDVYTSSGSTVGVGLIVQNKDHGRVLLRICAAKPDATDMNGYIIDNYQAAYIDSGENGAWVKAIMFQATINVQEQ